MRTLCERRGQETYFIMADVDPACHDAVRTLYYLPVDEGFGKAFPTDTPGLEAIYSNFERYAEEMVLQLADARPVPWEKCLLAFLDAVDQQGIDWSLCGSAALAVRGMPIEPHDIDLEVSDADSQRLGELLLDHLVEPHVRVENWICNWFARAFLHARLEWAGGVHERGDQSGVSDFGPAIRCRLDTVVWRGWDILVPPLDLQLEVNRRRGLSDRVAMIERAMAA
jgi:hypothetical protein